MWWLWGILGWVACGIIGRIITRRSNKKVVVLTFGSSSRSIEARETVWAIVSGPVYLLGLAINTILKRTIGE